jgi:hypothetical protein
MAAGIYNFTIEQGATVDFEVQYKDSNLVPVDLTGYSGRMQIRSNYADNSPVTYITLSSSRAPDGTGLNFSGSASRGLKPPTSGAIGVYILAESSSALNFPKAKYDLEIYSGSLVIRLLEGAVTIDKEVTRV